LVFFDVTSGENSCFWAVDKTYGLYGPLSHSEPVAYISCIVQVFLLLK